MSPAACGFPILTAWSMLCSTRLTSPLLRASDKWERKTVPAELCGSEAMKVSHKHSKHCQLRL